MNAKDGKGNTALHLCIMHSLSFPDLRSVKEMLIRGADRNLLNDDEMRPIDYADNLVEDLHVTYDEDAKNARRDAIVETLTLKKAFFTCC